MGNCYCCSLKQELNGRGNGAIDLTEFGTIPSIIESPRKANKSKFEEFELSEGAESPINFIQSQ